MVIKYKVSPDRPWFKGGYWGKGIPEQLDVDYNMNLSDLLERAVKNWGDSPVMWFLDTWVTYKELKDMVDRFSTYLQSIGVKKGDVVAVHLPNCIQYIVAYYGITQIGAVITGINPTYKPLEVLHQVKLTGAKIYFGMDALFFRDCEGFIADGKWDFDKVIITNLADLATGMSKVKKVLGKVIFVFTKKVLKKEETVGLPWVPVKHPNMIPLMEVLKTEPNVKKVDINPEEDVATLIMTGGTTGVPKAAVLTHQNCFVNAKQCEVLLVNQKENDSDPNLGHKTCMVGVLPLYHSFAMSTVMNVSIASGSWMMLFPSPPETEVLLEHIASLNLPNGEEPNGICYCGAEILFQRIAQLPQEVIDRFPLKGRLKLCMSGAGPLHEYVRIPFTEKTGAALSEGYGLSESSPVLTVNNFFGKREPGFIGVPVPGTDVRIFDREDFSKGPIDVFGEEGTGEICAWGPQVMKEYWEMPDRTEATIKEWDGRKWLLTGDIGFMDEHGRFAIRDRKKQLIKMAGHSVFPAEVESLLGSHDMVEEAAVAGLPDPKTGEAVKAWVVLKPEAIGKITADELKAWAQENMTRWKCPKYIDIIDEVPKNVIGKVMRRTLQEADPLFQKKEN
jgi:long-chain acyl-CoA synthetase